MLLATGATAYRLSDVMSAASAWGDLATLEKTLREGLVCFKRRPPADGPPTEDLWLKTIERAHIRRVLAGAGSENSDPTLSGTHSRDGRQQAP